MNLEKGKLSAVFIGYKGASYESWNPEIYAKNVKDDKDWAGLYIAKNESTAKGYLPDMVPDSGNGTVYIHKVSLREGVNLVTCLDESFKTGNINMSELKAALRTNGVDVKEEDLLIPKLGELGYFFKCYNNEEEEIEIIAPNNMAKKITMSKYKQYEVKSWEVNDCITL